MTAKDKSERKLLLIDVSALVYRAFFALPALSTSKGLPISALYGFDRMLNKALSSERPTHVVACFDAGVPSERVAAVPEYKANRPEMPDELRPQFPMVRTLLDALHIAIVEMEGEEADDCIATIATRASAERFHSVILSGDLDLLQLVDEHCTVIVSRRGVSDLTRYGVAAVRERYGLSPRQLPDFRGLKGDPSDNLPGVPGIGEKTAAKLVAQYGTLDAVLEHADAVTPKRIAALLKQYADQARRCRDASTAKRDLPIKLDWRDCEYHPPDPTVLQSLYEQFEFRSLLREVRQDSSEAIASGAVDSYRPGESAAPAPPIPTHYRALTDREEALHGLSLAGVAPALAVATVPELESWRDAWPRHLALATAPGEGSVIAADLLRDETVRAAIGRALSRSNGERKLFLHDAKNAIGWFRSAGIEIDRVDFDTMLAQALLDPSRGELSLEEAAERNGISLREQAASQTLALFEDGRALKPEQAAAADLVFRLTERFEPTIDDARLRTVLEEIELPLAFVLADMERVGFRLDGAALAEIRATLDAGIARLVADIHRLAGEEFNINSPKALAMILFEKLRLPSGAKTKTGYSTGVDVLAPLAADNEIVAKVLEFREVSKLKSTYVDALPQLVDPADGRLHTTLHQLGAATGRLASSNPNLQNIPIRSDVGRTIRRAFLPPTPGNVLLAADYSQIELRLMAHLSEDPAMIAAFAAGEDFHEYAARAVFSIAADQALPAEMRRRAKAVNFGILYGMGAHGLAQSVGFSRGEAKEFIGAYFSRFDRVRAYIDRTLEQARAQGFVTTIMGRRRYLPDLLSSNRMLRAAAERMATNAPLQGSAADLIKLAMVRVARTLRELDLPARLILQVHDELILDVPPDLVDRVRDATKEAMEGAAALRVPLVVDFKVGPNWGALE